MMKRIIFISGLLLTGFAYGQLADTITLDRCHELAINSYPSAKRSELLNSASEISRKKLNANYLPQVQVNGQASYQSDVTEILVEIPSFYIPPPIDMNVSPAPLDTPVPPKDQYRFTMDVNQVIYDGGITSKRKEIDLAAYEIEKQRVEIELHKLKESINTVFFSILLMQENEKLLRLLQDELERKLEDVNAAVEHGTALTSDRDLLSAEIIRVEQQMDETTIQKEAFIKILSELISMGLPASVTLYMPDYASHGMKANPTRPELLLFDIQRSLLEYNKDLITSTWKPKLSGFGQLGYGNPGLNFMEDKWTPYYIVGARLNWQFWNWNKNKKDKQILGLRQDIVDKEKETFNKNLNISVEQHLADMKKYERLMLKDIEIIKLRMRIAATASTQFDNGVITSSDYISRLNEEAQAKLNMEVHKVKLAKAKVAYLTTLGIL